jgi:hypothetical protein
VSDDVFSSDQSAAVPSLVAELVGEDKKFKTVEDLAKGKLEADSYIAQIEGENKAARDKLAELEGAHSKDESVAELLKAVREHQAGTTTPDDNQVSDENLSKKIREAIQGETEAQTRARNLSTANQSVLDKMKGDVEAARVYVAERAKQLGLTPAGLAELGERSPDAFTKLMDTNPSTGTPSVAALQGSHLPDSGGVMEVEGHRTKAYYTKLKAELGPAKYWRDTKIQGAYHKDAMFLGDRFNK